MFTKATLLTALAQVQGFYYDALTRGYTSLANKWDAEITRLEAELKDLV